VTVEELDHLVEGKASLGQALVVPAVTGAGKGHQFHILAEQNQPLR